MTTGKIVVIGAGIIGLCSAYYLHKKGYEVIVLEKESDAGKGASQFNGSQLSYTYINPLGSPHLKSDLLDYLRARTDAVSIKNIFHSFSWLTQLLLESRTSKFLKNKEEILQLALESRANMNQLIQDESLDFNYSKAGKLIVYSSQVRFDAAKDFAANLRKQYQLKLNEVPTDEIENYLPKEIIMPDTVGAIYSAVDEVGDSYKFSQGMKKYLSKKDVEFHFETSIDGFTTSNRKIIAAQSKDKEFKADSFVIASGIGSKPILSLLNLSLGLHPIKGYSTEIPNTMNLKHSVSDTNSKIVLAPLDNKIRIAGMADIGDRTQENNPTRVKTFKHYIAKLFPNENLDQIQVNSRIRPCLPSSVPLVQKHAFENLYLNIGHGFLGWTLAMGSGKRLADQIDCA